jgi:hypothetical protein
MTTIAIGYARCSTDKQHLAAQKAALVGGDSDRRWILSVDGEKPKLRGKGDDGREVSIDGELGG